MHSKIIAGFVAFKSYGGNKIEIKRPRVMCTSESTGEGKKKACVCVSDSAESGE